jgi:serine/threonine protein kinase
MELVNGVSLLSFLKSKENRRLEIPECKEVCYQIVNALTHLHEKNIVHRDIKLENILIDESKKVKILDFGFGCITNNKKLDFFCGTPSYMPPEIVQKKDYIGILFIIYLLGEHADIWSLGILFYTLLCGAFPFKAQNEKELYSKIIKGVFIFPEHVPNSACILIRKILHLTPSQRPSAEEVTLS